MGELVQFPGQPIDPENAPLKSDGTRVTTCDEHVHVFNAVPGRCQCGKNEWDPLLRTEKPKRRWPDDFRGFLSNVRPRKQR